MLSSGRYADAAAEAFAAKYAGFDPAAQVRRMAGRVQELLEQPAPRPRRGQDAARREAVFAG